MVGQSRVLADNRPVDKVLHYLLLNLLHNLLRNLLHYLQARFPDATAIQISATGTDDYRRWTGYRCSLRRLFSGASRDGRPLP